MGRIAHFHAPWCEFQLSWMSVLKTIVDILTLLTFAAGTKTPAGVRGRGDPAGASLRGGSPYRPRKAKCLERKSTAKFNTAIIKIKWLSSIY